MPDWTPGLRARLSPLRLPPAREADIIEELSQHLDDRRDELIAGGAGPDDATRLALAEFSEGNLLARYMQPLRQARAGDRGSIGAGGAAMWSLSGWRADVRDGWRAIARTPLQTATIVASLTIGSTLAVLMFGVVNAMVRGSMPGVHARDRLVRLAVEQPGEARPRGLLMGEFRRMPDSVPGLESVGAELSWRFSAHVNGLAVAAGGRFVSGRYFDTLGTSPTLGRLIQPPDDRAGSPPVAVIGHQLWQRAFGGSRNAIGAPIRIGTGTYEVVGVLPPGFVGIDSGDFGESSDERSQLWLPMREMWSYPDYRGARVDRAVGPLMIGRLSGRISVAEADSQARGIATALDPAATTPLRLRLRPFSLLPSSTPLQATLFITTLMSVPFIVLGIACANVAGIQLARATGRTHEISIRMSLGASRLRAARLVAIETAMMALGAAILAWAVATQALRLAGAVLPFAVIPDARVFLFAMTLPLGVTLAAGFVPAWRATGVNVLSGLRLGPRAGRMSSPRLRRGVVIGQVALSVLLLVTALLLVRSLSSLGSAIGPLQDDVLVAHVAFGDLGFDAERVRQARTAVAESVHGLPGIASTAMSTAAGLFRGAAALCWADPAAAAMGAASLAVGVTPGYFDTLGVRVRHGRTFTDRDPDSVVVVNEALAARLPGGGRGTGSIVRIRREDGTSQLGEVIGIVEDSYERVPRGHARPRCYLPLNRAWAGDFTIFARAHAAAAHGPQVQRILAGIDPRLSAREIGTVAELVRGRYRSLYWVTDGLGMVSVIALILSAVGLFALMSFSVSQRTSEFGIRLALGALPWSITSRVIRESLTLTLTGTAIGLVLALPLAGILGDGVLVTISWRDPVPPAAVAALLAAVAVVATLAPARRVFRIDPVEALRQE